MLYERRRSQMVPTQRWWISGITASAAMVLAACGASPEDGKTTSRAAEATEATAQQLVADIPVDLAEDEGARGYVIIPAGMVPVPAGQVAQEGSGYPRLAPGMVEVPYKVLPIPQGIGLPA